MEKKLKIILCILVVILIALISFVGVYAEDTPIFKKQLPDYELSSDFGEKRITSLVFDTNSEEVLNTDNYKKSRDIMKARLKTLGIEDYTIRMDESTGNIAVEFPENDNTDKFIQYLTCTGDFSLTDAEKGDVLLDRTNLKDVKVLYSNTGTNGVTVYLAIQFDNQGKEKLAEISKTYVKPEETEENKENSEENKTEGENSPGAEEVKEDNKNKVKLTIEGSEMINTYFTEQITSGELTISLGSGKDNDTLKEYMDQGNFYAMLINNEQMPIKYKIGATETVKGNLNGTEMYMALGVLVGIVLISAIYLICRFRLNGLIGAISLITMIAILLLIARLVFIEMSLNSIFAILLLILVDTYLMTKMFKNIKNDDSAENIHKTTLMTYVEQKEIIFITLVIATVFTFMKNSGSYTFGMTMFYGAISIAITNLIFLRKILLAKIK